MPATQRGHARRLASGKWQLRYYDAGGERRTGGTFPSKSAALDYFRTRIEPRLRGEPEAPAELTLAQLVETYLERHATTRATRTIRTLRQRLAYAMNAYGDVPLHELERMGAELADWQAQLPERSRYGIVQALRQTLAAAVRWGYITVNPARLAGDNPQPSPRPPDPFTLAEVDALAEELGPVYGPLIRFAAATGLRPEEWAALERRDVSRRDGILNVRRSASAGVVRELGKTERSRRQVPLSSRALDALEAVPVRLDTALLFPSPSGGLLDYGNWYKREWRPALEASGVRQRRPYDLRSTFISHALAAGVTLFELARIAGTSVAMIERSYGVLLDGAEAGIAGRLDALEAQLEQTNETKEAQ